MSLSTSFTPSGGLTITTCESTKQKQSFHICVYAQVVYTDTKKIIKMGE